MRFETRLRRQCSACTESSIRTYTANIKALAKLAGLQEVPDSSASWLDADLLQICKNETLGRYKRFAIAGRKALQAYGKHLAKMQPAAEDWAQAVVESSIEYDKQRNLQKRTAREQAQWPDDGYQALQRLARQLYEEEASYIYGATDPEHITPGDMYKIQRHFVILFYAWHALRGDLAEARILPKGQNYIYKKKDRWHLHIGEHKTVRAHGAIDFALAEPVHEGLDRFLPYVRATSSHGYLLSTMRRGTRLQRHDMLRMIRRVTEERLGKRLGVQMIRVLRVTEAAEEIDQAAELRAQMGHTAATQFQYVSK
jgi:hypothetical protein